MGLHALLIIGNMFILDDVLTDLQVKEILDANINYHNYYLQPKEDIECLNPLLDKAKKHFDLSECIGYEVWSQNNPELGWHMDKDEILFKQEGINSFPICTLVYYIRIENILGGKLLFENGTSIKPLQNRLVIFGPGIRHAVDEMFTVDGRRQSIIINPWDYVIRSP
jgi:hypothetical protein